MNASLSQPNDAPASRQWRHYLLDPPQRGWQRWWDWAADHVNPIVIKEVRQALKSRQFSISFCSTLIVAFVWTIAYIAVNVPRIYFLPSGHSLLVGYLIILTFPLVVVIPYGAFRSLCAETEDSTFELLSISGLSAVQIVQGKLASSCLQVMLYLSAMTPCIVLTYLLRGLDLLTTILFLVLTMLLSLTATVVGLTVGAIAKGKLMQLGVSVMLLTVLLIVFAYWMGFTAAAIGYAAFRGGESIAWLVALGIGSILLAGNATLVRAAAAAIDFPTENHTTAIRHRLLVLTILITFWQFLLYGSVSDQGPVINAFLTMHTAIIAIIGAIMMGEKGILSPRAQRTLPQTFLGRMFRSWFYPGAGLGYLFLISLHSAQVIATGAFDVYCRNTTTNLWGTESVLLVGIACMAYLALYLGLTRLLMLLIPLSVPLRKLWSLFIFMLLLAILHLGPLTAAFYWHDYRSFDYGMHQVFNVPWTITEIMSSGWVTTAPALTLLAVLAGVVFLINLSFTTRDVMLIRIAAPPPADDPRQASLGSAKVVDPFAD
ncbi:MAG: ABC transporter permease [Pirellulaceae bacterium]|nr:MAG: ABC transporter permease [Pirellulaceae bacterium]